MQGYYGDNYYNGRGLKRSFSRLWKNRQDHKNAEMINAYDKDNELNYILSIYISRFKWIGKPLEIFTPQYIERNLFFNGYLIAFKDKTKGFMILRGTPTGFNVYNEPTAYNVVGTNYQAVVSAEDCVVIRDNPYMYAPIRIVDRYCDLIADTGRSCEVYANAMKKPVTVTGSFRKYLSIKQIFMNTFNNEFFRVIDTKLFADTANPSLEYFQSDHNSTDLRGLFMYKKNLFDELLMKLGITSNMMNKGAQLTNDEVDHNNVMARLSLEMNYECREQATKQLSELAGEDIKCENIVDWVQCETNVEKESENKE